MSDQCANLRYVHRHTIVSDMCVSFAVVAFSLGFMAMPPEARPSQLQCACFSELDAHMMLSDFTR